MSTTIKGAVVRRSIQYLSTFAFLLISWVCCPLVFAQDSLLLEEVIVTAQKREQSSQDVGIAISAFSSQQLTFSYSHTSIFHNP